MKQYKKLIKKILKKGSIKEDRTGTGTISLFGTELRFDLEKGFPLLTTKKMFMKGIIAELLWFLEGSTDERRLAVIQYDKQREYLKDKNTIWTANANKQGKDLGYKNTDLIKELGPVYGKQWRATPKLNQNYPVKHIDQIAEVIESIKKDPNSRRHIVSAWNVAEIDAMALPPCHLLFQFYVNDGKLSCKFNMRSVDTFLGLPYNIASYALLTMMIAQVCDLELGELIFSGGDTHIYSNHIDACKEILSRKTKKLPTMVLDKDIKNIDDFVMDSFILENYNPHDSIKAEMAV